MLLSDEVGEISVLIKGMEYKEFYKVIDANVVSEIEHDVNVAMLVTRIRFACSPVLRLKSEYMCDIVDLCTVHDFIFSEIVREFESKYPGEVFKLRSFVIQSNYSVLYKEFECRCQFNGIDYPLLFSLVYNFLNPFTACARDYNAQCDYKWFHETRIWIAI